VALLLGLAVSPVQARSPETETLGSAAEVVRAFSTIPLAAIPPAMLRDAKGVAVIPHVVKAGFLVGGRFGRGVVLARRPDGGWGEPVFVTLAGGGFGLQAGIQSTDVILVFKTEYGLRRVLQGGGKLTLGGDAAVAAGPVGRQAEAATDGELRAEIYSYSRSRGLFAGVSLEGAALRADAEANRAFQALRGPQEQAAVGSLQAWMDRLSPPPPVILQPPGSPPVPVVPLHPQR
jgi:lipid-binding SYLF domain-containing protein